MCITSLKVNMLGGLSIQSGGAEINDSDNRSRKVWLLLAYDLLQKAPRDPGGAGPAAVG